VYAYISDVVDDWSCTAWYRYDGIAWARDDGPPEELDGNFDWGNLINSTSVPCNWDIGETNYLKANSTTDCPDTDAEYALPIFLSNWQSDMLETVWHNDITPDEPGDFGFIHSDCESYYYSESLKENVTWTTSSATNRPGSNCDAYDLESTNTTQSIVVDGTPPGNATISIDGGNAYSPDTSVTLTLSATDNLSSVEFMQFSNDGTNWSSLETYGTTKAWTLASGAGTKTVRVKYQDENGNLSSAVSDTIVLDPTLPDTPTIACTDVANAVYQAADNGVCFFRPAAASTVTITATAGDAQSDITHLRFQNLSPTTGWTPSPSLPNNDTTPAYTQALGFSGSAVSATIGVDAQNGAFAYGPVQTVTLQTDTEGGRTTFTAPSAAGPLIMPADAFSVTWTEGDFIASGSGTAGAGVKTRSLTREKATWNGIACGTFANDAAFSPYTGASPSANTGLVADTCYRWVQTLTDHVGNAKATTSGIIVRETSLGLQGQHTTETWDLGAGDGLAVNVFSGNAIVTHPIVSLPIRGSSVDLALVWNRHDSIDVGMGPGWRLDVFRRLHVLPNNEVLFIDADGARHRFTAPTGSPTVSYTRPAGLYATLSRDTAATPDRFTLTWRDGSTDVFDELSSGTAYLVREQDRHGNGVDLEYAGTELDRIRDAAPATDRLIELTWSSGKLIEIEDWAYVNAGIVQTGATGSLRATAFAYDGSGRLASWSDPLYGSGSCGGTHSHRTCLDYTNGLALTKTQTYTTESSGVLGSTTRGATTTALISGSDVTEVRNATEGNPGTLFSAVSATEVQVVRQGSGTSVDTTTRYVRKDATDAYARITDVKRKLGAAWPMTRTTWDTEHPVEPASVTEDQGGSLARTTSYTYVNNSMGLVSRIVEPLTASDDRWTDFTYNGTNDLTSQTVSLEGAQAVETTYTFAGSSCSPTAVPVLCAIIENDTNGVHGGTSGHQEDVTTSVTYDAYGRRLTQTRHVYAAGSGTPLDEREDAWTHDELGNTTSAIVNHADGSVSGGTDATPTGPTYARTDLLTTFTHDTAGNVVTTADPRRAILDIAGTPGADDYLTTTRADALGRIVSVEQPTTPSGVACSPDPGCRTTTTTYDEFGAARLVEGEDGSLSATVLDAAGRTVATFVDDDGAGGSGARQTSATSVDPQGRTLLTSDERQLGDSDLGDTTMTYDELGRLVSTTVADGSSPSAESTTAVAYDVLDRVTSETVGTESPDAQTTTTAYDKGGRVISLSDEFTCTTTTYDHRDLATQIIEGRDAGSPCTGAGSRTIDLTYDALGRLTERAVGADILEANAYDSAGRVTRTWATDGAGLRTTATWSNPLDEALETQRYLDTSGTLTERSWTRTTRDAAGNETDRCTWSATPAEWCHQADDGSWASPAPISRSSSAYDARSQRVRLYVPGEGETTYDPLAGYQVQGIFLPLGTGTRERQTIHEYDERDRLERITVLECTDDERPACTGGEIATSTVANEFTYDDAGNRTMVTEDNGAGSVTRYYCYDARDQLTGVGDNSDCSGNPETYTYDAAGNRTAAGSRTFAYTAAGQLESCTNAGCGSPIFDDDGRLTAITTASGAWTYAYDDEGRLVTACAASSCAGTPAKLEMTYDGEGHRIRLVETTAGGSPTITTTDFTYEGDAVVREVEVTGGTTVTRTFTTDEAGAIVKMTLATTGGSTADDGTYLVTGNGHGDTIGLAEIHPTSGVLTAAARVSYSTWGSPTVSAVNGYGDLGFRYLYVGRFDVQWDDFAGAGLHYMHARHYHPEFGRFLQPDPSAMEANLYGYTENNPVVRIDPSGERWFNDLYPFNGLERDACEKYPSRCRAWKYAAEWAIWYGGQTSDKETFNALRHCIWQCLLTHSSGWSWARYWGNLHETGSPPSTTRQKIDRTVDLHNNYVGRLLGSHLGSMGPFKPREAMKLCTGAWNAGYLWVYVGGRIRWSNGKIVPKPYDHWSP
jgi:RHS repeat-associated protein